MHANRSPDSESGKVPASSPSDDFLVAGMLGGDEAALTELMDRYDRLVRYTVFRASREHCRQDPQWLESVASATWAGFVRSMQRDPDNLPRSLSAYLVRIAKNQVISALRSRHTESATLSIDADLSDPYLTSELEEPIETLSQLEHLEALRDCFSELGPEDRTMLTQLSAITERRWKDAAEALALKESTLRSRWLNVLARLRKCLERKAAQESFARDGPGCDR